MTRNEYFKDLLSKTSGIFLVLSAIASVAADAQIVPFGSAWKYLDDGSNQGTAWVAPSFNDSSWDAGPAQLGYGGNGEITTVGYGGNSSNKYITTYFRHTFNVADPLAITGLDLSVVRDDGIVVYLNGTQVFSANMPASFDHSTVSSTAISGADEYTPIPGGSIDPVLLVAGDNTLAVEIHQQAPNSSDLSFDLELIEQTPGIDRGPYLQLTSDDKVTVRWRTTIPTDTELSYGPSLANLDTTVTDPTPTTEHAVTLTGLASDTTYYYSAGSSSITYAAGPNLRFKTHPTVGTDTPTRIWVLGDAGTATADQAAVRDAYEAFNGGPDADVVLMLGDNAYETGTDTEFQNAVFDMYPDTMSSSTVWPTFGNHDAGSASSATQSGVYYDIFTLPTNGEAGGVPSGTEAYYSFDYGQVHFVCLDSHDTPRTSTGAMADWLKSDLAATQQEFIIVFWHHPPYSKGGHDSDSLTASEGRLVEMREIFVPIIEDYGVDLALFGHSHTYQRSHLIDSHYGLSSTLDAGTMILDAGDGDLAGDGAYLKQPVPHDGAVYAVAGSSGKVDSASFTPHPVMATTLLQLGSMVIDVSGNQMDVTFLNESGNVSDSFAIIHGTEQPEGVPQILVPFDDTWSFLDNGSNQGSGENAPWQLSTFDDSSWSSGAAQLGYGGNGEVTTVGYGGNASNKYITTYFRNSFDLADPSTISALTVDVVRDDGAVVYLNGTEVFRSNMPSGTVTYTTGGSTAVGGADETTPFSFSFDSSLLVSGTNTIAVEIHQANATSSDLSFNLRLREAFPSLTREPYLQLASENEITVRWRTNLPTNSVVNYGTDSANLNLSTTVAAFTSDHSVTLTGLTPDTTYFYSVGSSAETFAAGTDYFFETHPTAGSPSPTRIWVLGDSGTADANAAAVRDAYTAYNGSPHADVLLMLGDNAYNTGTTSEYQAAVFDMYPETLRNTPLWSTLGNHDAGSATSSNQSGVYYDIFTFPTNAEAGGVASGTEAYYSFDYANIHFVCLNSQDVDRSGSGAMANWLHNDLASTSQEFIVAFWHHPPYSKGSHNSDTETQLVQMRQNFVPILESYGVDLVLAGHSHSYERSMLVDGHTGIASTFNINSMAIDAGDGDPSGDGAYTKDAAPNEGAVYAVAGSSGKITNAALDHPVMITNLVSLGSMVIDVDGTRMDVNFIDSTGAVLDTFAIQHAASQPNTPPTLTENSLSLEEGATVVLSSANLAATDIESDPANLVFTVADVTGGSFLLDGTTTTTFTQFELASGQVTFAHNGSEFAPTYTVIVSDGDLDSGTPAAPTIAYTPVNDAPAAADQSIGTDEDTPSNPFTLTGTDAENTPLTFAIDSAPSDGTLSGTLPDLVYTPAPDFYGTDSFTFTADDGTLTSPPATVTITVAPLNDIPLAQADSASLPEGTTLNAPAPGLLGNDSDPENDALSVVTAPVTAPAHGTLTLGADGSFSYTHDGSETTTDSFVYQIDDGNGGSSQASVSITITPVNDPPTALADSGTTTENGTLNAPAPGLLANDSDPENDALTVSPTPVSSPANGTLILNADGSYLYTHDGSETTTDSFTYLVLDGNGGSAQASVSLTINLVNDDPVANPDAGAVAEGETLNTPAPGLLSNDSDPENDPLAVDTTPVSGPANGTLTLNADGSYSYTHDGSESSTDSFSYRVTDGNGGSSQSSVTITVAAVNDPPVANPDAATLAEGATLNFAAPGLLANDSDPENDPLSVVTTPVSAPANGTLILNADGSFNYTHDGSETTSDTFTYQVDDGSGETSQASVSLTITPVNDDPIATADATSVDEGQSVNTPAPGLLANDSDPEGDTLSVITTPVTAPSNGTLTLNADGSFGYTHDGSETTTDSFTYQVDDGNGGTAQASVTISINGVNDSPVANDDAAAVTEGETLNTAAPGLLGNDSDPENDALSVITTPVTAPAHGTLTLGADGSFSYTHDGSETTSDAFTYQAEDGNGGSSQASVSITITLTNDAPVANPDTANIDEGSTLNSPAPGLLANDTDPENDALSVVATPVTGPTNGTLTLNADGSFDYTHDGSETTSDSFTYQLDDGNGGSSQASVSLTINPVNDSPTALGDTGMVAQGNTLTTTAPGLLANDTDPENDALSVVTTAAVDPVNGTLTLNTDGSYIYIHDGSETTADTFTYQIDDGNGGTAQAVVNLTITEANDAPVATPDTAIVAEGESLNTAAPGVLANDTDPENDPLTVDTNPVTPPTNGTLALNADGSFDYAHDGSETTSDSFTYLVTDGNGGSAQASVSITVTPVNDAPAALEDSGTTSEGGTLNTAAPGLLANDSDPENDALSVVTTPATPPANGTLTLNADGSYTYTHDGSETTSDAFTYQVSDGNGGSAQATVSLTITEINDSPVATADTATLDEGATLSTPNPGLLANDSDPENDALSVVTTPVSAPSNGTLTLNADGSFDYTHDGSETTSDSFTYQVGDGNGGTAQATVSLTINPVNDDPTAAAETDTLDEAGTLSTAAPGLLANDSDPEGDALTVDTNPVTPPTNGTLTLNADGSYTYTHDGSETTEDAFTYQVLDGNGGSSQASVSLTINPVNDEPTAAADNDTVDEGGTLNPPAPGLLANDTDPEDDALSVVTTPVTAPANGTLTLNADGSYTYTHDGSETTTDTFTYQVLDGDGGSSQASVSLTINPVNDEPTAAADNDTVDEGGTLNPPAPGLLANDTDPEDDALSVVTTPVTAPANGTLTLNADGSYTYTHDGSETTTDAFTYQVLDGNGGSSQASVSLTINPVNDAPMAAPDTASVDEGESLSTPAPGLLANDSDPEDDTLTVVTTPVSEPSNGTLTLNTDGSYTYSHDGSQTTSDTFVYQINDASGESAQASVTVTINPVNDEPTALADTGSTTEGGTLNTPAPGLLANDSDPENDPLSVVTSPVSGPANGTLTLSPDGSYIYTHDGSETTDDTFVYQVLDGNGGTAQASVSLTITPTNDDPTASPESGSVDEGGTLTTPAPGLLANDTDPENDPLTVVTTPFSDPANGTLTLSADGSYIYTHDGSETTADSFTYSVSDGNGGTAQATVSLTINPVNDDPVASPDTGLVDEGETLNTPAPGLLANDTDPEDDALSVATTPVAAPANGTLTLHADGSFDYTHDGSETTADSFTYQISDGDGGSSQASVAITINPVNDEPVATADSDTLDEAATLNISAPGLLANDTDPEDDSLSVATTPVTQPANGTLTLNANGAYSYTHDGSETTSDAFTYQVSDGNGGNAQATVTLTITPINDAPVAAPDSATLAEGETLNTPAPGLLANDSDPENDSLSVVTTPVSAPANGTLTLNADGSFDYTHDGSETISDSFTYQIDDGNGETAQATVAITITPVRDPVITRAPYIQSLATTSAIIRWSTDEETDSVVRYGTDSANLTSTASGTGSGTDHSVTLTGLTPETAYFYSVGDSVDAIATSPDYYLITHADPGTASATRLWVLGDSGTSPSSATAVRDAFVAYNGGAHADALILLGNNAALPADADTYQASLFDLLPATLGNSPAWPTPGTNEGSDAATYFNTFDQPAYYSFDHANIHVVSIDTTISDLSSGGAMATWLNTDLTNNLQEWVIVFFHHPPYSKGLHDSDAPGSVLEDVRTNILPILEANGTDLVLSAHSHSYERSALLDGHYGDSTTFVPGMAIDPGDGDPTGPAGGYVKQPVANDGTVYAVVGSSGEVDLGAGSLDHPAMVRNLADLGSLVVDISGNQLDANFIDATGTIRDTFQIRHETPVADIEIIIDNDDPGVSAAGKWVSATQAPGYYGDDYLSDDNHKKGNKSVTFTPDVTTAGLYSVSARWPASQAHSADVPVEIIHAKGSEIVSVDQTTNGDQWVLLGLYELSVGNDPSTTSVTVHMKDPATGQTTTGELVADAVRFTLESGGPPDTTAPAAPTNLASAAGDATVALVWDANSEPDLASYTVYRSTTSGSGHTPIAAGVTDTSYVDSTVTNGTAYHYVVTASDTSANESTFSNETSATPDATPDTDPPSKPVNLAATASDGTVSLTWDANTEPDVSYYTVYRSTTSGGSYSELTTLITSPTHADTTATNGTTYFYVVTATDTSSNESLISTESSATPQATSETTVRVGSMTLTVYKSGGKHYQADTAVTVTDLAGNPVTGATVTGNYLYNGSSNGSGSAVTASGGTVTFTSPRERARAGDTFGFAVTGIAGTDLVYDSAQNVATSVTAPVP